jgi:hypothetical protein
MFLVPKVVAPNRLKRDLEMLRDASNYSYMAVPIKVWILLTYRLGIPDTHNFQEAYLDLIHLAIEIGKLESPVQGNSGKMMPRGKILAMERTWDRIKGHYKSYGKEAGFDLSVWHLMGMIDLVSALDWDFIKEIYSEYIHTHATVLRGSGEKLLGIQRPLQAVKGPKTLAREENRYMPKICSGVYTVFVLVRLREFINSLVRILPTEYKSLNTGRGNVSKEVLTLHMAVKWSVAQTLERCQERLLSNARKKSQITITRAEVSDIHEPKTYLAAGNAFAKPSDKRRWNSFEKAVLSVLE